MTISDPLVPGSTIGIVGTGQLGRMLCSAAAKLGFRTIIIGPDASPPAAQLTNKHIRAAYDDEEALEDFAQQADVATYEFENIPPKSVEFLKACGIPVRPDEAVLAMCQDRLREKEYLKAFGAKTAPFWRVDSADDLKTALEQVGGEGILKSRRFGYDGKGQVRIKSNEDLQLAISDIGNAPAILEGLVRFECEVSQIAARSVEGEVEVFDLPRNLHRNGILSESRVPAQIPQEATEKARRLTTSLMEKLDYVGVMTAEFFWSEDDGLIANEVAPRVHNSGHWTVEACVANQFEQHIRAVAGWTLGSPKRHSDAVMTNLVGSDVNQWADLSKTEGISITLYGKREARVGRKMGHTVKLSPLTAQV